MKKADVDAVLREFEDVFREHGFSGSKGDYRLPGGIRLKVRLDRHGWDPDLGWGLLFTAEDTAAADSLGNVPVESRLQVTPATLDKVLDKKALGALYADNPRVRSRLRSGWFAFEHVDRLRAVLRVVLGPALLHVRAWAESIRSAT
ncbi:hypothetical protein [Saccharothrix variisporea]|uniref:DUF4304 domain-containing protein n=1 Tax=Saccharothrix variisporea TaxID=543527 RepID=A0A495XQZ8_9PSEU|nr:hypothetical protein [Saccharothrix variisporea]RKT74078.1 hypothetical protein DFJ66_7420 [Saccharothrix variisporea]